MTAKQAIEKPHHHRDAITLDCILTLLTGPDAPPLGADHAQSAKSALDSIYAEVGSPDWLSEGRACDIAFSKVGPDLADAALRPVFEGQPIDIITQRSEGRQKKLLIADMDSTMVQGETLDDLADFADVKDKVAAITARAMNGEIDFNKALRERVGLLKGLKEETLEQTYKTVKLMSGAKELLKVMRKNGAKTALVSGGFSYFTDRVAKRLKFHSSLGNELDIKRGKLTGKVIDPIVNRDTKRETLVALAAKHGLSLSETMAVGDGANDLPMLMAAGAGIAYHAKPVVAAEARLKLNHSDLRGLLYIQGYRDEDIDI